MPKVAISSKPSLGQTSDVETTRDNGSKSTGTCGSSFASSDRICGTRRSGRPSAVVMTMVRLQRRHLRVGDVDRRLGRFRQVRVRHVLDDADDRRILRDPAIADARHEAARVDSLAKRIEVGDELPGPGAVDDHDRRAVQAIVAVNDRPATIVDTEDVEESRD